MSEEAVRSVCGPKLLVRVTGKSRDNRDVIVFKKLRIQINQLTSVFNASALLLIMNFVITLSK